MGKMTSIMNMALMIGAVSAFENKQFISDRGRKERREDMDLKNSKSEKEKAEMQGHKEFDFNGHKIYALNQKNADKKARKLGLL